MSTCNFHEIDSVRIYCLIVGNILDKYLWVCDGTHNGDVGHPSIRNEDFRTVQNPIITIWAGVSAHSLKITKIKNNNFLNTSVIVIFINFIFIGSKNYSSNQACPFRASDVRDYPILVPDLPQMLSTSPTDLPSHISGSTRPTKNYDLSIHIYIS